MRNILRNGFPGGGILLPKRNHFQYVTEIAVPLAETTNLR